MNIFFVDEDPVKAAHSLVDKHVVKMILESCQLLSTAHRFIDGDDYYMLPDSREEVLYKATHVNHPSAIWCRKSVNNYLWLYDHTVALLMEYSYRYGKTHASTKVVNKLFKVPNDLVSEDLTPFVCAMPDIYRISDDPIKNYRNYYKNGKEKLHKWTRRQPPSWISELVTG